VPYVSLPSQFMSGKEALLHIVQVDGCTFPEAVKQLAAAIRDKRVGASWVRGRGGTRFVFFNTTGITRSGEATKRTLSPDFSTTHEAQHAFDVMRASVLRIWPVRTDAPVPVVVKPETKRSHETARPRPIHDGIKKAIDAIWPDGVPAGLKSKERDLQIRAWLGSNRHSVPARSLSR
jgi:hypothetical protein